MIDVELMYKGLRDDEGIHALEQSLDIKKLLPPEKLKQIADKVKEQIESNLMKGQSYLGGAVAPLKPSTIKRKGSNRLFYDTGKLFDSITLQQNSLTEFQIGIASERNDVAVMLNYGTPKMAARPFFGINQEVFNEIEKILKTNNG